MTVRRALIWVVEGTWEACVDSAKDVLPAGCEITLLHVTPPDVVEAASGAMAGLLGRGRRATEADDDMAALYRQAAAELLAEAAARLGRPARTEARAGRPEREVLAAAADVDVLVLARDRDGSRPGPHSIGHATRFVLDHAPCMVLLVWMPGAPRSTALPPEPHGRKPKRGGRRPGPGPPPGPPPPAGEPPPPEPPRS